ncbi:hypothetical protein VB779_18850 [Haloarculaceae archaeon H-GB11]|nr:hypothetical protein [Haloarculaceae archaeon H-GB1-1]MEA5388874.1 hypothetical protein [Haloarculaceae archaeon H-GB11]
MSTTPSQQEQGATVGQSRGFHPDTGMNVIGWLVFLPMLFVLIPLLPFILLYWLLTKLLDRA